MFNIFSIFIDLPIILLMIYAFCEIIWSRRLSIHPSWVFTKSFFLLIGTSLAYLMLSLGGRRHDIHMPEIMNRFFLLAVTIFTFLALAYVLKLVRITWAHEIGLAIEKPSIFGYTFRFITRVQRFILDSHYVHLLSFIGLLLLFVSLIFGQVATIHGL